MGTSEKAVTKVVEEGRGEVHGGEVEAIGGSWVAVTAEGRTQFLTIQWLDETGKIKKTIELKPVEKDGDVAMDIDSARPTLPSRYKEDQAVAASSSLLPSTLGLPSLSDSDGEPTLGSLAARRRQRRYSSSSSGSSASSSTSRRRPTSIPSTSLSSTLIQALHSGDASLLHTCLQEGDPRIIRETVKRLPSSSIVLKLLEALMERLSSGGEGKTRNSIEWLRQVLLVHTGYLITIPRLVERFAGLSRALEERLECRKRLESLNGRLELVMSQMELKREGRGRGREEREKAERRFVEAEEEEEEEDEEGETEEVLAPESEDFVMQNGTEGSTIAGDDTSEDSEEDTDFDEDEGEEEEEEEEEGDISMGFIDYEAIESDGSEDEST
ncbi:NUC189-domain-containing protein [Atractiella rhizophila]|nr:NUC189-domain-containing protein [Atractiella rhizophila]